MSLAPSTVIVYNQDGKPEKHSRHNARDLVQHCGYSWLANIKSAPNHPASFAGQRIPKGSKQPSQEVLDRVGGEIRGGDSMSAAERAIEQEAEEQRKQLELMKAAAAAAEPINEDEIADFSAQPGAEDNSDLDEEDDEGEDAAEEDVVAPPSRRGGRTRVGRGS